MKKKFVLVCSPFTENDYRKYGISQIEKLGFQILILGLYTILRVQILFGDWW